MSLIVFVIFIYLSLYFPVFNFNLFIVKAIHVVTKFYPGDLYSYKKDHSQNFTVTCIVFALDPSIGSWSFLSENLFLNWHFRILFPPSKMCCMLVKQPKASWSMNSSSKASHSKWWMLVGSDHKEPSGFSVLMR